MLDPECNGLLSAESNMEILENSKTTMPFSSTRIRRVRVFALSRQRSRIRGGVRVWGFIVSQPLAQLSSFVLKCLLTHFSGLASATSRRGDSAGDCCAAG
jgi:hypothetical protein